MEQTKNRLRNAYENIEFFASNTWTNSTNVYNRANQELFARENIAQDALLKNRAFPRTVRDVIPGSKLAQYSNCVYDEERESCYTRHSRNLTFYCPCSHKREMLKEPWMRPEIEQLFIWFSFTPDFDILELMHLEDFDDHIQTDCKPSCCLYNFHHIYPNFCDSFEESRSKTRNTPNTSLSEVEMTMYKPIVLTVDTFEEMVLRIQIRSDKVKHLWSRYSQAKVENGIDKKGDLLKSPLGNSFFLDEGKEVEQYRQDKFFKSDWLLDEYHLKRSDFSQLQYLADSIRTLKTMFFKNEEQAISLSLSATTIPYEEPDMDNKAPVQSTRRLYSAVLQGLGTETNKSDIANYSEVQDQQFPIPINIAASKPSVSVDNSFNVPDTVIFGNQKSLPIYTTASSHGITQTSESSKSFTHVLSEPVPVSNCVNNKSAPFKILNTPSSSAFYSETAANNVSNVLGLCLNSPYFVNSYSGTTFPPFTTNMSSNYSSNSVSNNNSNNNANYSLNSQYPTNFHSNTFTNTGLSYTNTLYPPSNAFQSNQIPLNSRVPQFNRAYPSNQMHSMWFVSQNRTPPIYSVTHYTSQPYLYLTTPQLQTPQPTATPPPPPPPRQTQRWQYPVSYVRPPNPYHITVPPQYPALSTPQQWSVQNQNVYRVNSNQQIDPNQQIESYIQNRSKVKTKKVTNTICNTQYKLRSKSPDELSSSGYSGMNKRKTSYDLSSSEKQFFIKTAASTSSLEYRRLKHNDYKPNDFPHIGKRASAMTFRNDSENFVSSDSDGSHTLLPIASSLSEDLERQALEQYQNSNENFYQELERQAEEQYDEDRSENWLCPPYKTLFIGGLITLSILFY